MMHVLLGAVLSLQCGELKYAFQNSLCCDAGADGSVQLLDAFPALESTIARALTSRFAQAAINTCSELNAAYTQYECCGAPPDKVVEPSSVCAEGDELLEVVWSYSYQSARPPTVNAFQPFLEQYVDNDMRITGYDGETGDRLLRLAFDGDSWFEAPGSNPTPATTPCGCEVNGVQFCNFDAGATGSCEPCADFATPERCQNAGLPSAGALDCLARCFPWQISPLGRQTLRADVRFQRCLPRSLCYDAVQIQSDAFVEASTSLNMSLQIRRGEELVYAFQKNLSTSDERDAVSLNLCGCFGSCEGGGWQRDCSCGSEEPLFTNLSVVQVPRVEEESIQCDDGFALLDVHYDGTLRFDAPDLGSAATTRCGCEVNGVQFCAFDEGATGSCEPCANYANREGCLNGGFPPAGTLDCVARCFPATVFPISAEEGRDSDFFVESVRAVDGVGESYWAYPYIVGFDLDLAIQPLPIANGTNPGVVSYQVQACLPKSVICGGADSENVNCESACYVAGLDNDFAAEMELGGRIAEFSESKGFLPYDMI